MYHWTITSEALSISSEQTHWLSVEEFVLKEYDELTIEEFKKVLIFLQAVYKDVCNKNTVSSFPADFGACIGGRVYLLHLHHCLMKIGDRDLMACDHPTLDNGLKSGSMKPFKPLGYPDSIATERSLSPIIDGSNFHMKSTAW